MAEMSDMPAWVLLFAALYSVSASIGELLKPGSWARMLEDFVGNDGLRFLTGIVLIALGAIIYLANPWNPADWVSVVVTVLGGGMALEGAIMLAFGDVFMRFSRALIGNAGRAWAAFSLIAGIALGAVALARLG
jgi:hypothetical protein